MFKTSSLPMLFLKGVIFLDSSVTIKTPLVYKLLQYAYGQFSFTLFTPDHLYVVLYPVLFSGAIPSWDKEHISWDLYRPGIVLC